MTQTLYSNLGTGTDVYSCCTGWTISGTGTLGTSFTTANEFQVVQSGNPIQIDVAVGYVTGVNSFYLDVDADNGGQPGAVLASFTNLSSSTNFGYCCGLISIFGIGGLSLNTGTNYWMVLGPTDSSATTWGAWNFSNSAMGLDAYSTDGGKSWINNGNQPQGAFDILTGCALGNQSPDCGPPVPEPGSVLLFGSGILGLVGVLRGKLNL
jgi:PEP-CTERM motif